MTQATAIYGELPGRLDSEGRLRRIPAEYRPGMVDLCSNDYLGLATRMQELQAEFGRRFGDAPMSSSASRLLSGRQRHYAMLEERLGDLYRRSALLFNSGYHANTGCISALNHPGTLFVCDKLIHASIVDGLRCGGCEFTRFRHNDMEALRKIVAKKSSDYDRLVVVTESIFSMDGDEAPLRELAEIKRSNPKVMLYLDEAHGFGVRGDRGLGLAEEQGLMGEFDILILTFGKAAASSGAAAVCDAEMRDYLLNTARSFIFSTALPPACAAWTYMMIEKIEGMTEERDRLKSLGEEFRCQMPPHAKELCPSTSQIIPFITGDPVKAVELARRIGDAGYLALPIRRPTVPPGGDRIRLSLNAALDIGRLSPLFDILESYETGIS